MKAEELKKLIDGITENGYEILKISPVCYALDASPRKILTGAYALEIAPIRKIREEIEREEAARKQYEAMQNQPMADLVGSR